MLETVVGYLNVSALIQPIWAVMLTDKLEGIQRAAVRIHELDKTDPSHNEFRVPFNGWAIKNVTFCILTISHSLFILMSQVFFQNIPRLTLYRAAYTLVHMIV